jgi:hypothetical protein
MVDRINPVGDQAAVRERSSARRRPRAIGAGPPA